MIYKYVLSGEVILVDLLGIRFLFCVMLLYKASKIN